MSKVYIYVVDRDFGFAPNPFHGTLTLATCKPNIRRRAQDGDWVIGVGGARLGATGRCVFASRITSHATFDEYWRNPRYRDKRPIRNGSCRMMVGDNIYHHDASTGKWSQADSHHSYADGATNHHNLCVDTSADRVLMSSHFFYFGRAAPALPTRMMRGLGYSNGRNYRVYDTADPACARLVSWIETTHAPSLNRVVADPFDFENSELRYSAESNRVSRA